MIIVMNQKKILIPNENTETIKISCTDKLLHITMKGKRTKNSYYFRITGERFRCVEMEDGHDVLSQHLGLRRGDEKSLSEVESLIDEIKYLLSTGFY